MKYCLVAPCLFGLEGIVSDELKRMGIAEVNAENGRVVFSGSAQDIAKVNLRLRCAERVYIRLAEFKALTFDEMFEGVTALSWEDYLPENACFPVSGHSLNSALFSVPDCQAIIKKAVVERLKKKYKVSWFPEDGQRYQIKFALMKDMLSVYLDTSGSGLHKRGYRAVSGAAPLRETLAAAMVILSRYRGKGVLIDPFCGSGTIAIEAAMIARAAAPGAGRNFDAGKWSFLPKNIWSDALADIKLFDGDYNIRGLDLDKSAIDIAKSNALKAGVGDITNFGVGDCFETELPEDCVVVTNPPYGERLGDIKDSERIYQRLGQKLHGSAYILSAHPEFEQHFGRTARKKRKLYNGMIKCNLYMYY